MRELIDHVNTNELSNSVNIVATFCCEDCSDGLTVKIGDKIINKYTFQKAQQVLGEQMDITF